MSVSVYPQVRFQPLNINKWLSALTKNRSDTEGTNISSQRAPRRVIFFVCPGPGHMPLCLPLAPHLFLSLSSVCIQSRSVDWLSSIMWDDLTRIQLVSGFPDPLYQDRNV